MPGLSNKCVVPMAVMALVRVTRSRNESRFFFFMLEMFARLLREHVRIGNPALGRELEAPVGGRYTWRGLTY